MEEQSAMTEEEYDARQRFWVNLQRITKTLDDLDDPVKLAEYENTPPHLRS